MLKLKIMVRDGVLCLRISEYKSRCYKSLKSFLKGNPSVQYWNEKTGKFAASAANADENNEHLAKLMAEYSTILEQYPTLTVKEAAAMFQRLVSITHDNVNKGNESMEYIYCFLETIIGREKNKSGCNFELYQKLLKKCTKMFCDFKTWRFSEINYDTCDKIAKVMQKYPGYTHTAKSFRNMLGKAHKDRSIPFSLTQIDGFSFMDYAPKKDEFDLSSPDVLTKEQVQRFFSMSKDTIAYDPEHFELYYDFCKFMLHSFMAPCDVIKLKYANITKNRTLLFKRKKTHIRAEVPISPVMAQIIQKYQGQTSGGYIFPIMNDDKSIAYKTRDYLFKRFRERLARWLKPVGKYLGTEYDMYPYVFRHTAITMAIDNGLPLAFVAASAGTSIEMIQKHYYNSESWENRQRLQSVFMSAVTSPVAGTGYSQGF